MLDRRKLIDLLKSAVNSDTLLTYKHDPNSGLVYAKFRSVLTQQASGSLKRLINSEEYDLKAYYDNQHKKHFYTLLPHDSGSYTTIGLGIPSGSLIPTGSLDTFMVVSGSSDGWHIYSEDSAKIQSDAMSNKIKFTGGL